MKLLYKLFAYVQNLFKSHFMQQQKVIEDAPPLFQYPTPCAVINRCGCTSVIMTLAIEEEYEREIRCEASRICFPCHILLMEAKARENSTRKGYTEIIGSEKQVKWALRIRDRVNLDLPPDHPIFVDEALRPYSEAIQNLRIRLAGNNDAKWWIENRHWLEGRTLLSLTKKARTKYKRHQTIIKYINLLHINRLIVSPKFRGYLP